MTNTRYGDEPADQPGAENDVIELPPPGTNTQGGMAGIDEAAERSAERLEEQREPDDEGAAGQ